ncbi:TIGR00303 family protein [Pannus brasiliensis CCIBt3594]|uniref:UPF0284 protein V0288_00115 n=1 Tax=Pannus brasiliensis CCIBt3594 TaxID=1427578 RepID=A0AAW9QCQ1_9CHRO
MIQCYSGLERAEKWLNRYRGKRPVFACVLGFTETGLIEGISAAGATSEARKHTALADAEFLVHGPRPNPRYPLPPLIAGASPVYISRAVVEAFEIPVYLFNAGLPYPPPVACIDLGGRPARCLGSGNALDIEIVRHLFDRGQEWGEKLATEVPDGYLTIGECVVGGTTTAAAILTGLGFPVTGKMNSSHPRCNHEQKREIVDRGLRGRKFADPFALVAAVGDPQQIVVAGMAIAAGRRVGVLLAGGTQMLAVHALIRAIARGFDRPFPAENIVVGTTRWVAEDPTGDTAGLADLVGDVSLLAGRLDFSRSRYPALQAYERGFVKEGVGAGGCAIIASLYGNWTNDRLVTAIESLLARTG